MLSPSILACVTLLHLWDSAGELRLSTLGHPRRMENPMLVS